MALRAKRYFRDYEAEETVRPDGKVTRSLVYRGDLYIRQLSDRSRTLERYSYLGLSLLAGGLLVAAMLQPAAPNVSWKVVQGVSVLALIPAFCVLEGSAEAFFRKGSLKKEDYRERLVMLRVMGLVGCVLALILAVSYTIFCVRTAPLRSADVLCALFAWLDAAIYGGIGIRELCVPYEVIKAPPRALRKDETPEREDYFD